MRLWTLHPRYLDAQGLTALWRESLLARAVLRGQTRGYTRHPQLLRFRAHPEPEAAIDAYLAAIHAESLARGYRFDAGKLRPSRSDLRLTASSGQLQYEWEHLLRKLGTRSPAVFSRWSGGALPEPHPLFEIIAGPKEPWERG
jgi:hypothetical protein